ncbi:MAG: glycosyltransferase family protein [Candidatus Sumerlaeaceae bacterium]
MKSDRAHPLRVAYYISSHGFGHATRAAQVISALPADTLVYVKTMADEEFLRREAGRSLHLTRQAFDFGAWQASNTNIDWQRTFETAMQVHADSHARLHEEVAFLKKEKINAVVCDIPPTPLLAAQEANIPSVCVANFTWVEVFRRAAAGDRQREVFLRQVAKEYATATLLVRPGFALRMPHFRRSYDTSPIARRGVNRRRELLRELDLSTRTRLVLTYFGKWGFGALEIERAARLKDVAFLSFDAEIPPLKKLDPNRWKFEDVVASVDVVIAKPGYGTLGECMANATPVIYYPRCEFSEYFALRRELDRWGGAVRLSTRDFLACRWEQAIEQALRLRPRAVRCDGSREIAAWIVKLARH